MAFQSVDGDHLTQRLRTMLGPESLPAGARVPPLRQLAARLQISHVLVARLMLQLEAEGLVVPGSQRIRYTVAAPAARGLPDGTVVVLSDVDRVFAASPFRYHHDALLGVSHALQVAGSRPMLVSSPQSPADLERILAYRPSAWIALGRTTAIGSTVLAHLAREAEAGRPVAVDGDWLSRDEIERFPGHIVRTDHRPGGAAVVHALFERGRRRLVSVWSDRVHPGLGISWVEERAAGTAVAVGELGIAPPVLIEVPTLHEYSDRREAFQRQSTAWAGSLIPALANRRPPADGLLTMSDGHALMLMAACRLIGREPGDALDIAGYDDCARGASESTWAKGLPSVTVDKNGAAVGRALAEAITAGAAGRRRAVIAPSLIELDRTPAAARE